MAQAAAILALAERLRKRSRRIRSKDAVADLRLATWHLKELAALQITKESAVETDPARKLQLEQEAAQLYAQTG